MSGAVIRLTVPGELAFRDVAIRSVAAACRLVRDGMTQHGSLVPLDLADQFDAELVSAVSEIFNNIVIHGYQSHAGQAPAANPPPIDIELHLNDYEIEIVITDHGASFDIESVRPPELESLPEGGMGIHIARSCVDALDYTPGPPNKWTLIKRAQSTARKIPRPVTQA